VNSIEPVAWRLATRWLTTADHTLVMGVLNMTPDSFSDGGSFVSAAGVDVAGAVRHAEQLVAAGADIIDVGGESTRPGAGSVDQPEEMGRVIPVVEELARRGIVVSIDTTKPAVAGEALAAGAEIVNDVTALHDDAMRRICADAKAGVVLMHMRGNPRTMQDRPEYEDVVTDVTGYLRHAASQAEQAGIDRSRICLDPGIGFGKTVDHNLQLLASLRRLTALGYPVLVGTSRKSSLGAVLEQSGVTTTPEQRDPATAATVALAVAAQAAVVRVHQVPSAVQAARTADAIVRAGFAI
jgi:dihydropteroate synthase